MQERSPGEALGLTISCISATPPASILLVINSDCVSVKNSKNPWEAWGKGEASPEDRAEGVGPGTDLVDAGVRPPGQWEAAGSRGPAPPSPSLRAGAAQPGRPPPPSYPGLQTQGIPHSLCGKSSALKTFRQKCAPRRATPVGLSRLLSMSSLSSEGSFLSSYNTANVIPYRAARTTPSRPRPAPPAGAS